MKEIEKILAKLVPGGPTIERSEFETRVLVYFCADRQGIESMKWDLAGGVGSLISEFKKKDMNDDFAAFIEKMYNDIPAKNDPLRAEITVETLKRLYRFNLLPLWDDRWGYGNDDIDDAAKRIQALIRANEPAAMKIAIDILHDWARKYDLCPGTP